MHRTSLILVLALGAFASAQPSDDVEPKQGDRKDGEDRRFDRDAWLRRHKDGPVYRVEVLFRYEPEGRLFYLRKLISPAVPTTGEMPGLTLNERGETVGPPDPGRARLTQLAKEGVSKDRVPPPPPIAETTRYLGVSIRPPDGGKGHASIHVSDLGTGMTLPARAGDVTIACFCSAIFRIERLDTNQLQKEEPLRQSPAAYQERTAALAREFLTTRRADLMRDEHCLCVSAHVLKEAGLVAELRKALNVWIDRTPEDVDGKGVPTHVASALALSGDASDFAIFRRLCQRHPKYASYLNRDVLTLIVRVGAPVEARQVMRSLLDDTHALSSFNDRVVLLRKLDGTVPEPSQGDDLLLSAARELGVKPSTFRFRLAQARLLEFAGREPFSADDLRNWKECVERGDGDWAMMTEADRQRGVDAAMEYLKNYRPAVK